MTKKEIATKKVKKAADEIFHNWQMGLIITEMAHEELTRLNGLVFDAYDFGLFVIDPDETQDYIHSLQDKLSD